MTAKTRTRTTAKKPAAAKAPAKPAAAARGVAATAASRNLRRDAETKLRRGGVAARPAASENDRLVHELQVHKVELELQNEALRSANQELAALHERYHDLYDFAPVAYLTVSVDRRVLELNLAAARLLGRERYQLPGRRLADFIHPNSSIVFDQFIARALLDPELTEEALLVAPSRREPVYVKAQARRFDTADGPVARVVLVDLSALKHANEELARSLETFFRYWRP
jgi:PAS domain S-box-containing protein